MFSYVGSGIASGILSMTNHSLVNINNHYNLHINTMKKMTDEQRKEFLEDIKIQVGNTFYKGLKNYMFDKMPESELLKYFK